MGALATLSTPVDGPARARVETERFTPDALSGVTRAHA